MKDPFDKPTDDPAPRPLPQDYGSPASDPDDVPVMSRPDHPDTDSRIDTQERYDEGLADASVDNPPESD